MTKRPLSPDERDLWRRVVRDVAPLDPRTASSDRTFDLATELAAELTKNFSGAERDAIPSKSDLLNGPSKRASSGGFYAAAAPSVFAAGDPRVDRHMRRGRRAIDATFDLHGHTQATARGALLGFLLEARARGARSVLVITGKGAEARTDNIARRRGVLNARFQEWLNEPDFRRHITRASPADQRHGGGGAFYVFLKR